VHGNIEEINSNHFWVDLIPFGQWIVRRPTNQTLRKYY